MAHLLLEELKPPRTHTVQIPAPFTPSAAATLTSVQGLPTAHGTESAWWVQSCPFPGNCAPMWAGAGARVGKEQRPGHVPEGAADGVPAERTPGEGPAGLNPPVTVTASPQQGWWHPATAGEGGLGGVARPCPQAAAGGQGCSPRGGARSCPPAAAPATAGRGRPAYLTPSPTATP